MKHHEHHPNFTPPVITGAKTIHEYVTALRLWWAFRAIREAGQNV